MIITAAYTGMRWGEITGLQWIRTYLDEDPRIQIDPEFGALHEISGRLELGPPKTPASVRPIHLPPFLAHLLTDHRNRNPQARFVFTGSDGGLHRRSNFRRRVWLPALTGNKEQGWAPIQAGMHFHDLRHTHKTRLIEDNVPRVLQLERLGHKRQDVSDHYSHVTRPMIETTLTALQARWEEFSIWTWTHRSRHGTPAKGDHYGNASVVTDPCSHIAPKAEIRPPPPCRRTTKGMALRHQEAVRPHCLSSASESRFWFAALSVLIPRRSWREIFPVTPGTLLAWHPCYCD